jgi:hypothetical protein
VVINIDPKLKRDLYSVLALEGLTLKDWFIFQADRYVATHRQPTLFVAVPPEGMYVADEPRPPRQTNSEDS